MKWLYYCLALCLLMSACGKDEDVAFKHEATLAEIFAGRLSESYIRALERMQMELSYMQMQLIALGEALEGCELDLTCITSSRPQGEIEDFKRSLRLETLPEISVEATSNDIWEVIYSVEIAELQFDHKALPLSIHLDLDNGLDDGRNVGMYPVIKGTSYATEVEKRMINLIRPTTDAGPIQLVRIGLESESISFLFEGGNYGALNNSEDASPVFMQGNLQVSDDKLQINLEGLYYVLIPKGQSLVEYTDGALKESFIVSADSEFTFYREDVKLLRVRNAFPSDVLMLTDVRRLQFDARPGTPNFELDFDHSFKDRGQRSVTSTLVIDEVLK